MLTNLKPTVDSNVILRSREIMSGAPVFAGTRMKWQEIRTHYPHQWLLLEVLNAHSKGNK